MHRLHFSRLGLCNEASDVSETSSGAPAPAADPATPEAPAASAAVSRIDRIQALFRGADKNAALIADLQAQLASLTQEKTQLLGQLDQHRSELENARTLVATLTTERDTALAEIKKVDDAVVDALSGIGVSQADLPAAAASGAIEPDADELAEQAERESDPVKKALLAKRSLQLLREKAQAQKPGRN